MGELDFWKKEAKEASKRSIASDQKNKELEKELNEVTQGFKRFELLDL